MHIITTKRLRIMLKKSYDKGLNKGYELGWQMKQVKYDNRGIIIAGSRLDQELEDILKHKES